MDYAEQRVAEMREALRALHERKQAVERALLLAQEEAQRARDEPPKEDSNE